MGKNDKSKSEDIELKTKFVSITFESSRGRLVGLDREGVIWIEALINQGPTVASGQKFSEPSLYGKWIRYRNQFEG